LAAASYLSVIGPNKRAAQAVSESSSALIQNVWGMVSLPAIKLLSLKATRLLKGAAMAERITIAGVPCFVLSKDPCPDVLIALKRFARQGRRRTITSRLSTIDEREDGRRRRQRSSSITLRRRHVIFHLTGGGFFAHTLASDLPYLLDWSKTTGAMIICPEYSLLPEHTFPVALNQVCTVYTALMGGSASNKLGFDVNRIVVTGESTGGNLAAAMCVKLGMVKNNPDASAGASSGEERYLQESGPSSFFGGGDPLRLPDALMLSCAALNLSLELSPSRVIGDQDPVLPSGLISAISDAYAGQDHKQDPLVSPLYASDEVLCHFPPTLLFASSDDPLLDDSVHFNTRLRCLGVESELRATHHMPHAYWGLGMAGFPEAQQVQLECQEFLLCQLQQCERERELD
jgi:acetyl esterase/lipase